MLTYATCSKLNANMLMRICDVFTKLGRHVLMMILPNERLTKSEAKAAGNLKKTQHSSFKS